MAYLHEPCVFPREQ